MSAEIAPWGAVKAFMEDYGLSKKQVQSLGGLDRLMSMSAEARALMVSTAKREQPRFAASARAAAKARRTKWQKLR